MSVPDPDNNVKNVEEASSLLPRGETLEKSQDGSSTLDHLGFFDDTEPITIYSGNLPHLRQEGVSYFVTFRTADSLPQTKIKQWEEERNNWVKLNPKPHTEIQRKEYFQKFPRRIQYWLDQDYGDCLLNRSEHEKTVVTALKHFDGTRYHLDEFVVASNHIHVIVTPIGEYELTGILQSWKSYTANQINKAIGKTGVFWQKESFDHMIRSPESAEQFRHYIRPHHKVEEASSLLPRGETLEKSQDGSSSIR